MLTQDRQTGERLPANMSDDGGVDEHDAGSAIMFPNVGMASVRMVLMVVHDALFAVSVS